jgi:hypothetical protein
VAGNADTLEAVSRPAALACLLAAVVLATGASAATGTPATRGGVLLGVVSPDPASFDRLTGKHHVLHVIFGAFRADVTQLLARERAAGRIPVLSLSSPVAPARIAAGAEDGWLVGLSRQANATGQAVWIRPLPEMNGGWNPWCAFDESGRSRGPSHATAQFVRAFRRMAVILRGGRAAAIDRTLASLGLPPLRAAGDLPRSGTVRIVWNPQGHGTPFIPANGPRAYWPGGAFVDVVGDDLYSDSGEPSWRGMDVLYAFGKPFLVAEWALEREDDPAWIHRMFAWVLSHPRTVGLVYFDQGWSGGSGVYRLGTKPRGLAAERQEIRRPRFAASAPG